MVTLSTQGESSVGVFSKCRCLDQPPSVLEYPQNMGGGGGQQGQVCIIKKCFR